MKIKGLLIIVICMIGLLGCTSKGFDIERVYQFVEIQSSNGKEIGTIVNSDDLEFFFEEMKFQEWKYIEEKEDFGKCIYKFIAYEFVKDDEEYYIREDPYELYKVDDNYYIIQDSDVISIPKSAGQFLNSIENKITITQPISEDILDNWENRIVNNTDSSYGTKKKTYNDETIVSKITKIVISDEDELDIKIDITPKSPYDKYAMEMSLENLLSAGQITFEEYVNALPEDSTMPKSKLKEILKTREEKNKIITEIEKQGNALNGAMEQVMIQQENQNKQQTGVTPEEVDMINNQQLNNQAN